MSKRFICSDAHLGHRNITKYRTNFSSAEEHHNIIYDSIASAVSKRDVLWLLGDIAFDKYWLEKISKIHCRKILIVGNHDLDFGITMKDLANTYDELYSLKSKHNMWFSHCPIHPREIRNRLLCIHGHTHYDLVPEDNYINVCMEHTDYKPVTFADLPELQERQIKIKRNL